MTCTFRQLKSLLILRNDSIRKNILPQTQFCKEQLEALSGQEKFRISRAIVQGVEHHKNPINLNHQKTLKTS